jgi:hypothetical protein
MDTESPRLWKGGGGWQRWKVPCFHCCYPVVMLPRHGYIIEVIEQFVNLNCYIKNKYRESYVILLVCSTVHNI